MKPAMRQSGQQLVDASLQHLECEARALRALNITLLAVQSALKQHDTADLPALVEQQQQAMSSMGDIRKRRQILRQNLAHALQVPVEEVRISEWASRLPAADRSRVMECRQRVAELADQTSRLASSNIAAVTQGIQLLHEVMSCLTGRGPGDLRYSPQGDRKTGSCRPLFNTRC